MMCWCTRGSFTPEKFAGKECMKSEACKVFCLYPKLGLLCQTGQPVISFQADTPHPTPFCFQNPQITPVNYFTSESSHITPSSTESCTHLISHKTHILSPSKASASSTKCFNKSIAQRIPKHWISLPFQIGSFE